MQQLSEVINEAHQVINLHSDFIIMFWQGYEK